MPHRSVHSMSVALTNGAVADQSSGDCCWMHVSELNKGGLSASDPLAVVRFGTPREVNDAVCLAQTIVGPTRRYDFQAGRLVAMFIAAIMLQLHLDRKERDAVEPSAHALERKLGAIAIASDPAAALRAFAGSQPHRYLQAVLPTVLAQPPAQILATVTIALARVHAARRRLIASPPLHPLAKRAG